MVFNSNVNGQIMAMKPGKKDKMFMKVFDVKTSSLVTVFEKNPGDFKDMVVGEVVDLSINVITDNAFCSLSGA